MSDLKSRISKLNDLITKDKISIYHNGDTNFKIFDYDPEDRYKVRDFLYNFIYNNNKDKMIIIDIYETIIDILKEIDYIDIIVNDEKSVGTAYANQVIQEVLGLGTKEDLLKEKILEIVKRENKKIIVITGLEGCYQIIRGHTILSILETSVTENPLIMFYPGTYDGQGFSLFNKLSNDNGYNAMIIAGR